MAGETVYQKDLTQHKRRSAQLPRRLLLLAPKVTKRVVTRNASCRPRAFAAQYGKTAGAGIFLPDYPVALIPYMQKVPMPQATSQACCFTIFFPKPFC